ncbi:hypothetical protein LQW54_000962 [Pestalotiopsis sp. IQ-011]
MDDLAPDLTDQESESSGKVFGSAVPRIREKLTREGYASPRSTEEGASETEEQYTRDVREQQAVAAGLCAERENYNSIYGPCVRCAYSGMYCDYSPPPGQRISKKGPYMPTHCRRCERAGAKFCMLKGSQYNGGCLRETIILVNGSEPTRLKVQEEDLEDLENMVNKYLGRSKVQLQPGIWTVEPDVKRLPIPLFPAGQDGEVSKDWKDVLPDARN